MQITIRYFASLREALGPQQVLDLPEGSSLAHLRDTLIASSPRHGEVLARGRAVRCALNQQMADETRLVPSGAEVAFFPPVTGG